MEMASPNQEDLGLGLKPGDPQYRAYVGPPEDYDLIAAMAFNLLTTLGLRQHHSLLDVGCGSLRIGRLLIPYPKRGKYFGVEPNEWLVEEGIRRELGEALLEIKRPAFFFSDSPQTIAQAKVSFDFALAQSIFSHSGLDLIKNWLSAISNSLAEDGVLIATFLPGEEDSPTKGWVDRKSTRLNSSHSQISYAVFCLKKKKNNHARMRAPYISALEITTSPPAS